MQTGRQNPRQWPPRARWALISLGLMLAAGCRDGGLQNANAVLSVSTSNLEMGQAYANQQSLEKLVVVHNTGRSAATITYDLPNAPFSLVSTPVTLQPGDTTLRVRFQPTAVQAFFGAFAIQSDTQNLPVNLSGTGIAIPSCGEAPPCHTLTFDITQNGCVDTTLNDGTECDPHSVCITAATCMVGRCIGTQIDCDDHNLCTLDSCNALTGCQHSPAPPCPGDGSCQIGVCDPLQGCGFTPAPDGNPCGPQQDCDAAQVCISGACVIRDPPDGYVCQPATPCQGQGVCAGTVCQVPPATTLSETWRYDSEDSLDGGDDGGIPTPITLSDFVLDEASGDLALMGFFQIPILSANTAGAIEAPGGAARRCLIWNDRLVCADYPAGLNGQVTAIDRTTGSPLWSFVLPSARPDFAGKTQTLFMGRMAALGSDRLAALFEGYVAGNTTSTSNCRLYFLVVLDASGGLISASQLTDVELTSCDHPHPYGFASDVAGNLFVGFAPTVNSGGPPLMPAPRTTVMSFTRDGAFQWKFTDYNLVGGEIAVANGRLYHENSEDTYNAATGLPFNVVNLGGAWGRAVATTSTVIQAPLDQATVMNGFSTTSNTTTWSRDLLPGVTFWGDQLRLATWKTPFGPNTVALTFTQDSLGPSMTAFHVEDGRQAFSCRVSLQSRGVPQLLEVGDENLALMEGAGCEKCDPPFASSFGAFHTFSTPHLSPAIAPWVGTFGGAGHDGQEDQVTSTSTTGGL